MLSPAVFPYSIDEFVSLLAKSSGNAVRDIESKRHKTYFDEYFGDSGVAAKTILFEKEYVDRDFLEDFAAYYVRCFESYDRYCSRLHFFDIRFTGKDLERYLSGDEVFLTGDSLQEAYLGFIVVKHLPKFVIGRTCLKTYDGDNERRRYPITRTYSAHLFGMTLEVKTLAFQEQDRTAAACATSSLWSVFQGTGKLFDHKIPSPVKITEAATRFVPSIARTFPNHGLTVFQMADAMRDVGLEPQIIQLSNSESVHSISDLKKLVYGYLGCGIPIALGLQIPVLNGGHAVAVTGFSLEPTTNEIVKGKITRFLADLIDEFYVHDDQLGPFSRLKIDTSSDLGVIANWPGRGDGGIRMRPFSLVLPLYHKIRIPLETILYVVTGFNESLAAMPDIYRKSFEIPDEYELIWDVHLVTVSDYKREVREAGHFHAPYKIDLLGEYLPKYLWKASALYDGIPVLDLLFDATDVEMGKVFQRAYERELNLAKFLRHVSPSLSVPLEGIEEHSITKRIFDWFAEQSELGHCASGKIAPEGT